MVFKEGNALKLQHLTLALLLTGAHYEGFVSNPKISMDTVAIKCEVTIVHVAGLDDRTISIECPNIPNWDPASIYCDAQKGRLRCGGN